MNKSNILRIPLELKSSFLKDPENFIRDIACISTESTRPFFKLKHKIFEIEKAAHQNPFDDKTKTFIDDFAPGQDDRYRRFMHIDLGYRHDAVGISMCHAPYFEDREMSLVYTDNIREEVVREPFIFFDFIGRIKADFGDEILLGSIREIIYEIARRGFYIALITYDGFQSVETLQELWKDNYTVANLSLDRTVNKIIVDYTKPFNFRKESTNGQYMSVWQTLKDIIKDERTLIPNHDKFIAQAQAAEVDYKKKKIFAYSRTIEVEGKQIKISPSLDLLEAMAGAAFNAVVNELYGNVVFDEKPTREEELEERQEKEFYGDLGEDIEHIDSETEDEEDFGIMFDYDGEEIF